MFLTTKAFPKLAKKAGAECYIHETGGKPTQYQHRTKDGYLGIFPIKTVRQARKWFNVAEGMQATRQGKLA